MWIGDYLRLPHCTLAISEPRQPCFKFNDAMGFNQAAKLMQQSGYCGAYLTVIETGSVGPATRPRWCPAARSRTCASCSRPRRARRR